MFLTTFVWYSWRHSLHQCPAGWTPATSITCFVYPVCCDHVVYPTPFIVYLRECDTGKWIFVLSVCLLRYISSFILAKLLLRLLLQLWLLTNRAGLVKFKAWLDNLVSRYVAFLENGKELQILLISYLFLFCRILIHLYCSRRHHQKNRLCTCTSNYISKYEYTELFAIRCRSELKFTFARIQ